MSGAASFSLKETVVKFCAEIAADPLLVQGAGGNISWKDESILWVKASGTWLSEAENSDIFVPVDLLHLQKALEQNNFSIIPKLLGTSTLKPSIETLLHALMPQKIVAHLHAIEPLAYLVRKNCDLEIKHILGNTLKYSIVDYYKPGEQLARAVKFALQETPDTQVVFMKNHGIVTGEDNISNLKELIEIVHKKFKSSPQELVHINITQPVINLNPNVKYIAIQDDFVQQLAFNSLLFENLSKNWRLYPDHLVFLGPHPFLYHNINEFLNNNFSINNPPATIFIKGIGVYMKDNINQKQLPQLRCYYEIIARQNDLHSINSLSKSSSEDILNWEAEKYRKEIKNDSR